VDEVLGFARSEVRSERAATRERSCNSALTFVALA
jgi:hypothetical protein